MRYRLIAYLHLHLHFLLIHLNFHLKHYYWDISHNALLLLYLLRSEIMILNLDVRELAYFDDYLELPLYQFLIFIFLCYYNYWMFWLSFLWYILICLNYLFYPFLNFIRLKFYNNSQRLFNVKILLISFIFLYYLFKAFTLHFLTFIFPVNFIIFSVFNVNFNFNFFQYYSN